MMNRCFILIVSLLLIGINSYGQSIPPKNVLLICIDDLRPQLGCFGAEYIHSPKIDALAKKGLSLMNHYVNAPICGPSGYTLLTGKYGPAEIDALFQRAELLETPNA